MVYKSQTGWYKPEKTMILFERIFLWIGVGLGVALVLLLVIGGPMSADSKASSNPQNNAVGLLFLGGMALLSGLAGWGMRKHRHRLMTMRDDLLRNGEKRAAEVVNIVEDVSTMVNDQHPWRIHARCEIGGRLCEFQSWSLWEDPTSCLTSRTIDVYFMPNDPARYFVDTRFLEPGTGEEKGKFQACPEPIETRGSTGRQWGKTAEVEVRPRSDAYWLSRHFTVPRLLFAISLPLLVGGGVWLQYEVTFLLDGELIEGRLEDRGHRRLSRSNKWYTISYQDPLGRTGRLISNQAPTKWIDPGTAGLLDWLLPQRPMQGEGVILRADWRKGRIRVEKWMYWLGPILVLTPGVMFSAIAWYTRDRSGRTKAAGWKAERLTRSSKSE